MSRTGCVHDGFRITNRWAATGYPATRLSRRVIGDVQCPLSCFYMILNDRKWPVSDRSQLAHKKVVRHRCDHHYSVTAQPARQSARHHLPRCQDSARCSPVWCDRAIAGSPEITGLLIDQCCFGTPERVRSVPVRVKTNAFRPVINDPCILTR